MNVVHIEADFGDEEIDGAVRFTDSGANISAGPGCVANAPNDVTCRMTLYSTVKVALGDGSDVLTVSSDGGYGTFCEVEAWGGPGRDLLTGTNHTVDCLAGGPGADRINGRGGGGPERDGPWAYETLSGGRGNDQLIGGGGTTFFEGGLGNDVFHGGGGVDYVDYADARAAVHVDRDGVRDDGTRGEQDRILADVEGIIGSRYSDVLIGGSSRDILLGNSGPDLIRGRGGADTVEGETGRDDVGGGEGPDKVAGGWVNDYHGGHFEIPARPDVLWGGSDDDLLFANDTGADGLIHGGPGRDRAFVDSFDVLILSIERVDVLSGPYASR